MEEEGLSNEQLQASAKKFEQDHRLNQIHYYNKNVLEQLVGYYLERDKMTLALEVCEVAMEQHPYHADFYAKCAHIQSYVKDTRTALTTINRALGIEPNHPDFLQLKAQILEQMHRYYESLQQLDLALAHGADKSDVLLQKAHNLIHLGKNEEAIRNLKEVFSREVESDHLFYEGLFFLEQTGTWELGLEIFEDYTDIDPFNAFAWNALGTCYYELQKWEKAIWALDFVVALDEDFSDPYLHRGYSFSELKKYEEAAESFRKYLELETPDPLAYSSVGDCFRAMDRFEEAREYYRQAISLDPKFVDAWYGLGLTYSITHDHEKALKFFKQSAKLRPEEMLYTIQIARLQVKLEMFAESIPNSLRLIEANPHHQSAWIWLAEANYELGKKEEAIEILNKWLEIDPEDSTAYYIMAAYQFLNGDRHYGSESLAEGLTLEHENVFTFFRYAPELEGDPDIMDLIRIHR